MKKRIATGILLFFTTTMLLGSVCSAEEASTADFNEATVQSLIKKADSEFVYNDKGGDGTLTINKAYKKGSQYPVRKGVILVTPDKYKGLIPTGHAAIVYKVNKVVESLSKGVYYYVEKNMDGFYSFVLINCLFYRIFYREES